MGRFAKVCATLVICASFTPALAFAQEGSITGTVRDSGGGVLPGVSVEVTSPALIEKVRVATTDGNGVYRVVSLRPGTYVVTFTLTGFASVRREGIELTGAFTATVNAEMRVGSLQETLTVTAATPIVDTQAAQQQRVLNSEVVEAIPTARTIQTLAELVPGVTTNGTHDVGGTALLGQQQYSVHGSLTDDYRIVVDGFVMGNGYQSFTGFIPNLGSTQEVTIQTGAAQADQWSGGVQLNVTPKDGGNTFKGSFFANGATSGWQSDNYTQRVRDRHLASPNTLKRLDDINPSFGGPIVRDKLWFYGSARWVDTESYAGNAFFNKNAGLADVWTYEPDFSRRAFDHNFTYGGGGRVTWQANAKNKFTVGYDYQKSCTCQEVGFGKSNFANTLNISAEAQAYSSYPHTWMVPVTWTFPATNRLLLEAGVLARSERNVSSGPRPPNSGIFAPDWGSPNELNLIPVLDYGTGVAYHGVVPTVAAMYSDFTTQAPQARAAASYVSGAHALKFGFTYLFNRSEATNTDNNYALRYIFFNGVPISVMAVAAPWDTHQRGSETALYAQDRWTVKRMTLNLGARFDQYKTWSLDTTFGPAILLPNRNFTIPGRDFYNLKDISPRLGVVYDVFGNGKTAVRASANRYAGGFSVSYWDGNPGSPLAGLGFANTLNSLVVRSWTDTNHDFKPDCDFGNSAPNGECGAGTANFGQPVINLQIDPRTLSGWDNRGYNWEFTVGVQQELLPRVSVDAVYIRRVFGNFLVNNNRALAPSDYDRFSVTVPQDPRLPNGGGYVINDLFDLNPAKTVGGIPQDNYRTFSDTYGKQQVHWDGVDVSLNARPGKLVIAGGVSTGRPSTDNCDVVSKLGNNPSANAIYGALGGALQSVSFCKSNAAFLTFVRGYAAYTLPKIDVQVAGTLQSMPVPLGGVFDGGGITATRTYTNAEVVPGLGRSLSGGAQTVNINMVQPATLYGERLNQIDFRVGKLLRFGRTRTAVNLDLFNAFNRDTILGVSPLYATWQNAQTLVPGRIAKLSAQFNF